MSVACVYTRAHAGMDAPLVSVEVHLGSGLPGLAIVGLVETAVRESRERVRAAICLSGFDFPQRKITVNLAPADLPKSGGRFDLAIALGILAASDQVPTEQLDQYEFYGELAFTGELRHVARLLPAIFGAQNAGRRCVVPGTSAKQVALFRDMQSLLADHLIDVVRFLSGENDVLRPAQVAPIEAAVGGDDIADIEGQQQACLALQIAAAGNHNILMVGPPGAGKTMLARCLPSLLPDLTEPQIIESLALQSAANLVATRLSRRPPFRAPHHTASAAALVGGGNPPSPGEISLAHNGVLFLDELPEFSRHALEAMREPLETGLVRIARARRSAVFPSRFQLVAAMNPCPCGFTGEPRLECRCTPDQVRNYQGRISGPLLDRIDIGVFLHREAICLETAAKQSGRSTTQIRDQVVRVATRQLARSGCRNAQLCADAIREYCWPDATGRRLLERAAEKFQLSRRGCNSVLRVARTISDLADSESLRERDIAAALQLRVQLSGRPNVSL